MKIRHVLAFGILGALWVIGVALGLGSLGMTEHPQLPALAVTETALATKSVGTTAPTGESKLTGTTRVTPAAKPAGPAQPSSAPNSPVVKEAIRNPKSPNVTTPAGAPKVGPAETLPEPKRTGEAGPASEPREVGATSPDSICQPPCSPERPAAPSSPGGVAGVVGPPIESAQGSTSDAASAQLAASAKRKNAAIHRHAGRSKDARQDGFALSRSRSSCDDGGYRIRPCGALGF